MLPKIQLAFLFSIIFISIGSAQRIYDYSYYDYTNFETGYSYNFKDSGSKDFHLLTLGLNKTRYGGRHGGGYTYGLSTEIGLNTRNFTIGPKISAMIYYQFIVMGSEFVAYTDFKETTLRYVPIIGIGGPVLRITVHPNVILTNKSFKPVNKGSVQLIVNIPLEKKSR